MPHHENKAKREIIGRLADSPRNPFNNHSIHQLT